MMIVYEKNKGGNGNNTAPAARTLVVTASAAIGPPPFAFWISYQIAPRYARGKLRTSLFFFLLRFPLRAGKTGPHRQGSQERTCGLVPEQEEGQSRPRKGGDGVIGAGLGGGGLCGGSAWIWVRSAHKEPPPTAPPPVWTTEPAGRCSAGSVYCWPPSGPPPCRLPPRSKAPGPW